MYIYSISCTDTVQYIHDSKLNSRRLHEIVNDCVARAACECCFINGDDVLCSDFFEDEMNKFCFRKVSFESSCSVGFSNSFDMDKATHKKPESYSCIDCIYLGHEDKLALVNKQIEKTISTIETYDSSSQFFSKEYFIEILREYESVRESLLNDE